VSGGSPQRVGTFDPGDAVRMSFGMAYAINAAASFTLGYKHDFIQRTETEINDVNLVSSSLDVGALLLGFSYRLNERTSVNTNLELGMTEDSPDVSLTLRVPYAF
jgi:long-subunit fatty acid transport protein